MVQIQMAGIGRRFWYIRVTLFPALFFVGKHLFFGSLAQLLDAFGAGLLGE